jgi:hypothetical protein
MYGESVIPAERLKDLTTRKNIYGERFCRKTLSNNSYKFQKLKDYVDKKQDSTLLDRCTRRVREYDRFTKYGQGTFRESARMNFKKWAFSILRKYERMIR